MPDHDPIPTLVTILYGEEAPGAWRSASVRLRRWAQAFDGWLGERHPIRAKNDVIVWRRLCEDIGKMPWTMEQADIERHARRLERLGYAPGTISHAMSSISKFYGWCAERRIDPACAAGFNPAEKARRPSEVVYPGAKLLSRVEVQRLLRAMRRDGSALGRRDYAFILARLRLGAPSSSLIQLRWGQIELDGGGTWVRWRVDSARQRLPGEVWEAIQSALESSGRLASIGSEDYVFAPLADQLNFEMGNRAEDWLPGRHLHRTSILHNLRHYGRLAGIPDERLTLNSLRHTAIRLRLDQGASVDEMQEFMDSGTNRWSLRYKLSKLPELPDESGQAHAEEEEDIPAPAHKGRLYAAGEGLIHGYFVHSLPAEEVAALAAEGVQGIGEEIVGLRTLSRGLLERQGRQAHLAVQLWEAYNLAAGREAELIKAERELNEQNQTGGKADQFLEEIDRWLIAQGKLPIGDQMRQDALGSTPELEAADRRLAEEIATLRLLLRNGFALAMEEEETQQYIRMVDLYGSSAVRLSRLLKLEHSQAGKLDAFVEAEFKAAIDEVLKGFGFTLDG
jgi:integrase